MTMNKTSRSQSGFSMMEVLVSILIVSLGILGTLGLLMNGLRLSSSSNYRSIAAAQANAMADALRGNPFAISGVALASFDDVQVPASSPGCFTAAGCARANFVNNNVWVWQQQLAASLPNGVGTICRSSVANVATTAPVCNGQGAYVVSVCWNEQKINASSTNLDAAGTLCTWTAI
jgi:type IV pilus assembly protein PilV